MNCIKKVLKGLAITGGLMALIEVIGVAGEAQALSAMHGQYPEEVDGVLKDLKNEDVLKELSWFRRTKAKTVALTTEAMIEGFSILDDLSKRRGL